MLLAILNALDWRGRRSGDLPNGTVPYNENFWANRGKRFTRNVHFGIQRGYFLRGFRENIYALRPNGFIFPIMTGMI